jgi:hypothetical protein
VRQANLMADAVERSLLLGAAGHEDKRSDAALRLWQAYDRYARHNPLYGVSRRSTAF